MTLSHSRSRSPLLWFALVLLAAPTAQAQDPFLFRFDAFPGAPLADEDAVRETDSPTDIALYATSVGGAVPISHGGTRVLAGARYENLRVDVQGDDRLVPFDLEDLHVARVDLMVYQRLTDEWTLGLIAQPSLASDFKDIGGDDVKLQATALVSRRSGPRRTYGAGVSYRNEFGQPSVVPLLQLESGGRTGARVSALLPVRAYAGYAFGGAREVGISARMTGMQYNINADEYLTGEPDTPTDVDVPVEFSVLTVGPTATVRLSGPLVLVAEAGTTIWRRFAFDGERLDTTLDQDRSLFARVGIAFRGGGSGR